MSQRVRQAGTVAVWLLAAGAAIVLGMTRFRAAAFDQQPDLEQFLLPAARAIRAGHSPYTVPGYFYTPLAAFLVVPFVNFSWVGLYWTALLIVAGIAACMLGALASTRPGERLLTGTLTTVALISLFWTWPMTLDLYLGQIQVLVLLAVAATAFAAARNHRFVSGFALGMAAVVKTWPAAIAVWLLRRGGCCRGREWLGMLTAAVLAVALALLAGGPSTVLSMFSYPLEGTSQSSLAAYSVWGVPAILFSPTSFGEPLVVSPTLRFVVSGVLAVGVLALGVIVLRHPGPPVVALCNTILIVLLLLPMTHSGYVLIALPALWWWAGRALQGDGGVMARVTFGVLLAWWLIAFRIPPAGGGNARTTWGYVSLIFGATLVATAVSVLAAASLDAARKATPVTARAVR